MKKARILSQGIFLLLFLFLFIQTEAKGLDELGYPVRLFLDFDPLILITTLLAAHDVAVAFYLSIILIAVTALLGRVFCGWVCPLGTLHNIVGFFGRKRRPVALQWHRVKYLLLVFLLVSSLFSLQWVGIMDPLSLLIRSFSLSVYPAFNAAARGVFDAAYLTDLTPLVTLSEPLYDFLKKTLLAFEQPRFRQAFFVGVLFVGIIGLNLHTPRFWCRYLCPLGALLGLLGRKALLTRSVSEGCTGCGLCAGVCQAGASPEAKDGWRQAECVYCWNCDDVCPHNAVRFGLGRQKAASFDLGRRRVLAAAGAGVFAVPLLRSTPLAKPGASEASLIRPPGSLAEPQFLERCVKCGECMKVCITNGLQPTLLEAGLEGIWSPVLVPRIGYCEYRCTLCGQVCPTGAIRRLPLEEKMKVKLGLAMIDKGRCLPYAQATPCIVCEEVCPTSKKAIWFEEAEVMDRQGRKLVVKQPRVDLNLCIGCGICETKCPVLGQPAIYVISVGESRSKENQVLL